MRVLDLFSGIGGFSLGLERAGMKTVAFCEIDPYCRRVLAKHWPEVPIYDDVTGVEFEEGQADVICGGFTCQDISIAGRRAGVTGERSGLYREVLRAICMVRPKFAIMENVAELLANGMGRVLGDLAENGNDTEWDCISASEIGAPHGRDRVWITVANADKLKWEVGRGASNGWWLWSQEETWQSCLLTGWEEYSATWPKTGMTRSGIAYRLARSGRRTGVTGFGSPLPTPTSSSGRSGAVRPMDGGSGARKKLKRLATPTVSGNYNRRGSSATSGDGLITQMVAELGGPVTGKKSLRRFVEWMMGFPQDWTERTWPTESKVSATPSSRKSRK